MGALTQPSPVKLICSVFAADDRLLMRARVAMEERHGPCDFISDRLPFDHTPYYAAEFGEQLVRQIVAFERLVDPGTLADIKRQTNVLEERWMEAGRRQVNLDPGYVTLAKLVLATTKNNAHRIYLREGIFAEITLRYRAGIFQPWEWTYPDYASRPYCALFEEIRRLYQAQLRSHERVN